MSGITRNNLRVSDPIFLSIVLTMGFSSQHNTLGAPGGGGPTHCSTPLVGSHHRSTHLNDFRFKFGGRWPDVRMERILEGQQQDRISWCG